MQTESKLAGIGEQLVTFFLAGEELAVPIASVQEIVRLPQITKVPNAPAYVEGIANLRGNILPIVNLRNRLGLEPRPSDDRTRVVVLNSSGATTGIVVDSVAEVLHIEESTLESPPQVVSSIEGQFLRGLAKIDNGKRLIMIVAEDKILPEGLSLRGAAMDASARSGSAGPAKAERGMDDEEHLVTFMLASEEFALDIMQIQEIIRVTQITFVPRSPEYVKGVMSLRNRLIPIIDLRKRFHMEGHEKAGSQAVAGDLESDARRIIVVDLNGILSGIEVDSVSEVLTLPKSSIEPPPAIISADDAMRLKGVGKLDKGERLLMLLDIKNLVSAQEATALAATARAAATEEKSMKKEIVEERQLVCFRIQKEEFGIDIMLVQEIIRIQGITAVPRAPAFVEGIVNLRGNVLPVLDMRKRFGLEIGERTEQNRIVVVDIKGRTVGIIVDSVSEVLRIPRNQVEALPQVAGAREKYIEGIGKLQDGKRIIMLVDVDSLLSTEDGSRLDSSGGGRGDEAAILHASLDSALASEARAG